MTENGDLSGLVDAAPERVAGDFGFTEGPIWHPVENWLMFSDIAESKQYLWSEEDGLRLFRQPSNQSNGNCFDLWGRIVSCEHASSQLVRHTHGGKMVEVLASHYDGLELNSPNDVVCDRKGRLWLTDPAFGRTREDLGGEGPGDAAQGVAGGHHRGVMPPGQAVEPARHGVVAALKGPLGRLGQVEPRALGDGPSGTVDAGPRRQHVRQADEEQRAEDRNR